MVRALHAELIGPYQLDEDAVAEQELLELPPSQYYLTGFLSPEVERAPEEVAEDDPLAIGDDENEEETHALRKRSRRDATSGRRPSA